MSKCLKKRDSGIKEGPKKGRTKRGKNITKTKPVRELTTAEHAFNLLDINNDGEVSFDELHKATRYLGWNLTKEEAKMMIETFKPEHTTKCCLSKCEFMEFFEKHQANLANEMMELLGAFRKFDVDESGVLSASELRAAMKKWADDMDDAEIEELISLVDEDGDGQLNIREFASVLCDMKEVEDDNDDDDDEEEEDENEDGDGDEEQ